MIRLDSNMKLFGKENHFYHSSIRRYVALFGSLFSDIYIKRVAEGGREDFVSVPIKYAVGNAYSKIAQDESREVEKVARILPAMAFKLENVYKDKPRHTNPQNRIQQDSYNVGNGTKNFQFNRIPYNLLFGLSIRTKNSDDMMQIVEQIIPAFDGNLSITIEDTTGISVEQDIIVILDEISMEDNYESDIQNRLIEWKITFEMKGYLYKRTQNKHVIKEIDIIDISNQFDPNLIEVITDQYNLNPVQDNLSQLTKEAKEIPTPPIKVKRKRVTKNE